MHNMWTLQVELPGTAALILYLKKEIVYRVDANANTYRNSRFTVLLRLIFRADSYIMSATVAIV